MLERYDDELDMYGRPKQRLALPTDALNDDDKARLNVQEEDR